MKGKIKGFVFIELIISVFILSIISIGIYKSIITLQNINRTQEIQKELLQIGKNIIESEISGISYIHNNNEFDIDIKRKNHSENLGKIIVNVYSQEIDYETKLSIYYEIEN